MPEIVVVDINHVLVDGVAAGCLLDVLRNYKPEKFEGIDTAILSAFQVWDAQWETAKEAGFAERDATHAAAIASLQAQHADAIAEHVDESTKLREEIAGLKEQVTALGGTERGQELARLAKIKAAQDAIAKAQADIDALGGVNG